MFTLAHEMGHAMHSYYSNSSQPYIYSQYKIFVAEVASTCNEVLLMEYLLKNTTDKKERAYLLNHYLDSFKGTVYRQTMFAEYEMLSNKMVEEGESLTAETLNKLYYDLNCKYFGPDMVSDSEIAYEWARIPHFYYNFYVYQYATGFSSAVALAHGILKEGAPAVERYKKFLSGGCSASPVELLKIAGVNLETPKPIQEALDVFGEVLDEIVNTIRNRAGLDGISNSEVEVLIDAPEKAKKLCHILSGHKGAFDLAKGRYIVDGKSIIGVCTMDLSTPLTLTIHEEDDTVLEEIREFVVKAR